VPVPATAQLPGRLPRPVRAIALLHPFPSAVNAILVFALFLLAGGAISGAFALAAGMLGLQVAIGVVNDLADQRADAATKPGKPLPSRLVSRRTAIVVAIVCMAVGLAAYAVHGALPFVLGLAMLGCGLAYDLGLKARGLGWLCYAVAFPLLPLSTWLAASGSLPPRPELLLPVAALAGPTLQLANGLVDLERDQRAGVRSLALWLGRRDSIVALAALTVGVYGIGWVSLLGGQGVAASLGVVLLASLSAGTGVYLSANERPDRRERGWQLQVVGIALLGGGWLLATVQAASST
jgi:4-hydroxybenzoate polyprenyltransferase